MPDAETTKERFSYVLAPQHIGAGDTLQTGPGAEVKAGNALPLSAIPVGQSIHNVELHPGRGGQMARAAGTAATLVSKGVARPPSPTPRLPEALAVIRADEMSCRAFPLAAHFCRHGRAGACICTRAYPHSLSDNDNTATLPTCHVHPSWVQVMHKDVHWTVQRLQCAEFLRPHCTMSDGQDGHSAQAGNDCGQPLLSHIGSTF